MAVAWPTHLIEQSFPCSEIQRPSCGSRRLTRPNTFRVRRPSPTGHKRKPIGSAASHGQSTFAFRVCSGGMGGIPACRLSPVPYAGNPAPTPAVIAIPGHSAVRSCISIVVAPTKMKSSMRVRPRMACAHAEAADAPGLRGDVRVAYHFGQEPPGFAIRERTD